MESKIVINEMNVLKEIVEETFMVDIMSKRRHREIVEARIAFCKIMRDKGVSLSTMGRYIKKTHATILYYTRLSDIIFKTNPRYAEWFTECKKIFTHGRDLVISREEKDKEKTIDILNKTINSMYDQSMEAITMKRKYSRLINIIQLIDEKVKYGSEELAYKKISAVLNSI